MDIKLKPISISISLLGIFILLLLISSLEPPLKNISELNTSRINQQVKIKGQILSSKEYDSFQIIKIKDDSGEIDTIIRDSLNLSKNKTYLIYGKLIYYNEQKEIEIEKITSLS